MMGYTLGEKEMMLVKIVRNLRHCVSGERVAKAFHDLFDARPVLTDLAALCVAVNHRHAEVTLGGIIPLLLLRGHGKGSVEIR